MSLNPFATVGNYPAMLTKIATWTFFVSLGATAVLRLRLPAVEGALGFFSFAIPVAGIEFPVGTLVPAFAMALISRVAKLHDRLSDLTGIRRRFDRQEILLPLASASGAELTLDQLGRLDANRNNLMGQAFYRFVSSDSSKSKIDTHYVTMALDQWSWYWVVLEALFVVGVAGGVLYVFGDYRLGGLAAWIILGGTALLQWIRSSCSEYAADEIREILKVDGARTAIRSAFGAL